MKTTKRSRKATMPSLSTMVERTEAKKAKAHKPHKSTRAESPELTVESLVIDKASASVVTTLRARITPELCASIERELAEQPSDEVAIGMAIGTFCQEAVGVGCFVERYWHATDGIEPSLAPHQKRLGGGDVGAVLVYLSDECRKTEAKLVQGTLPEGEALATRAQKYLTEIRSGCEVVVDDGVEDKKDVLVLALRKQHKSKPDTVGELTNALASYVTAARSLAPELSSLAGFDMKILDEAQGVVDHLLARGNGATNDGTRATRIRRNRLLAMMYSRVSTIRKVARFTFRNYPDILREAASAAHRERRRMAKREELEGDEDLLPEPTDDTTPEDDDTNGDI